MRQHLSSTWTSSGTMIGWSHCRLPLEGGNLYSNWEIGVDILSLCLVAMSVQSSMTLLVRYSQEAGRVVVKSRDRS